MPIRHNLLACCFTIAALVPVAPFAQSQSAPPRLARSARAAVEPTSPVPNNREVASTQRQLIELLRLSPTLTTVVSHDPSLLADQEYVSRNNPQLAQFLAEHPEIARNPDFYLFTHMHQQDGSPDEALERAVWPEIYRMQPPRSGFDDFLSNMPPLLAFAGGLVAFLLVVRLFIENRRWSRTFKLQSEVHGRIIDRFASTQELAAYMETEAGKRFLEAAPIPLHSVPEQRFPNAVARVLTPLQIGVVMVLLGAGFLILRRVGIGSEAPMRILGVLVLMPGLGFILSAGITWMLAGHLGLMPARQDRFDAASGSHDLQ
jgi:hypothetical protein